MGAASFPIGNKMEAQMNSDIQRIAARDDCVGRYRYSWEGPGMWNDTTETFVLFKDGTYRWWDNNTESRDSSFQVEAKGTWQYLPEGEIKLTNSKSGEEPAGMWRAGKGNTTIEPGVALITADGQRCPYQGLP